MTRTIQTHNLYHLGDNLIFLHLLRSLAFHHPSIAFHHFTHASLLPQLNEAVQDILNIELFSFESDQWRDAQPNSIDTWKNADGFWERSRNRWNWVEHTLEHHAWTAKRMGLRSPISRPEQLLFDYPALNPYGTGGMYFYDFFVCNSEPCSGQFRPMAEHGSGYLDALVQALARNHKVITTKLVTGAECTFDTNKSVTNIGKLSILCRHHIMVATGPMWGTLNTTNHHYAAGRRRIVLLDNGESLNLPCIEQVGSVEQLWQIAKQEGWV